MNNKNDAPKIIIQLILGAFVYYLFTFKYKEMLITELSLQVYYQLLVIVVISNGYLAKWIDLLRIAICHKLMMKCSKKYKRKHYKEVSKLIIERSKDANLSDEAKKMIDGISSSDFELEGDISEAFQEISKLREKSKKS